MNPKAEEFKLWTAKFLDHGFFEFWKRLFSHQLRLSKRKESVGIDLKRLNSSSTEGPDANNFICQAHLFVFYIVLSTLIAVCFVVFLSEIFLQNAQNFPLFLFQKLRHFSVELLWTFIRLKLLMSRIISRFEENRNSL
jgi:hypothetical protein